MPQAECFFEPRPFVYGYYTFAAGGVQDKLTHRKQYASLVAQRSRQDELFQMSN